MSTAKKESVKSVIEEGVRGGKTFGVIMNKLRKKFDKEDEVYEKSIKYYASALCRAKEIDEDAKAKYVGKTGRGNKSKGAAKSAAKTAKRAATKSKAKAKDKPAKKTRKPKASKDDAKPAKKERKSRKKSKAQS
jgi:hypothetical protein